MACPNLPRILRLAEILLVAAAGLVARSPTDQHLAIDLSAIQKRLPIVQQSGHTPEAKLHLLPPQRCRSHNRSRNLLPTVLSNSHFPAFFMPRSGREVLWRK